MTNVRSFPVDVRYSGGQWQASCDDLRLQVTGPTRDIAEGKLLVLVYRAVADKIAAGLGDVPYEIRQLFLVAAVSVLYKALSGSDAEKQYARDLCEALGAGLTHVKLHAPGDILEYDPNTTMSPGERIALVLAALSEPNKDVN